ncbi:MAG: hypothetical protein Q9198_005435 [Flavoplaca austrocitrina]
MICCICNIPKGLEAFSKAQRKDPDNARCLLCVNDHLTAPLAHVEQPEDDEDDDGSDGDDDYLDNRSTTNPYSSASYRPGSEVASATSGLGALNLSEHDRWYAADNKTASVHVSESDLLGPSIGSHKGKGKEKENVPSEYGARSVTGSNRSLQIITEASPGNSGSARLTRGGNGGFANPPPGPPQRHPNDIIDRLKSSATGRVVSYSDDSDSDSEGSFGML